MLLVGDGDGLCYWVMMLEFELLIDDGYMRIAMSFSVTEAGE